MATSCTSLERFYIARPVDKHWNTGFPTCVIKGEEVTNRWGIAHIRVLEPATFKGSWPEVLRALFLRCEGPSKSYNHREYVQLVHDSHPEIPLPKGFKPAKQKELSKDESAKVTRNSLGQKLRILKNGATEPSTLITTTFINIEALLNTQPVAFIELVTLCRDPDHKLYGDTNITLFDLGLINGSNIPHQITKNLILSAVTGEGMNMKLGSPVAEV